MLFNPLIKYSQTVTGHDPFKKTSFHWDLFLIPPTHKDPDPDPDTFGRHSDVSLSFHVLV